jgi:hypothetical protein
MTRRLATLLLVLLSAAVAASPAWASHSQTLSFEAPRDLLDPTLGPSAFDEIAGLGAHRLRMVLYWHDVAPSPEANVKPSFDATDPAAYDWSRYDAAIDNAKARGWPVLLTVSGPVPKWATLARRDTRTRPSPAEFTLFMEAVARHYAGRVAQFAIWNEPNHPAFLLPQYFKGQVASPQWYRKLFFAGVKGLKLGGIANPSVLFGETAPRGTGKDVAPLVFLRGVLCLSATYTRDHTCGKLPAAGYAHHAYTTHAGPFFVPPSKNDVTIGVLGRLVSALDRAARTGAIAKHLPIYLTEFGIQSVPDPIYGVSQERQAEYQAISERLAWDQPRVASFSQYLLRDDLPLKGVPASQRYGGFESGLRFADGRAKESLASFPVPLVALRSRGAVSLWGLARPAGTTTKVTVLSGDRKFRAYKTYTTDARGYFARTVPYVKGRRYRLRWTSPAGRVYEGPPIRVYSRP